MEAQTVQKKIKPTVTPGGKPRGRHYKGQHVHVQSILRANRIQPKLRVGQPNDKFEQEADRVAEQVMRMPVPQPFSSVSGPPLTNTTKPGVIQRACAACSKDEDLIQTKANGSTTPEVTTAIGTGIQSLQSGGQPLSKSERSFFEPRIGADFSNVRVHHDTQAASVARSINAQAFTHGHHVVFGAGEYSPNTTSGRKLLAHELTHVVQQNAGTTFISETPRQQIIQRKCDSEFPCLRSFFPPGQVRFNDCTSDQLSDYSVMPETGTTLFTPMNGTWYDTDGFWFKHHSARNEWFKIPGHCDVEIHCGNEDFTCSKCCNLAATTVFGSPRWTSDGHGTTNPFA